MHCAAIFIYSYSSFHNIQFLIIEVSSFATPSTWTVETSRGATQFVLKGEEDIRRISKDTYLISDNHGVQYLIENIQLLDKHSRRLLDRFL